MKRDFWRNWSLAGVAGASVACIASAGLCQQDVLIPGGPVERTVRPLEEVAQAEHEFVFVVDDESKKSAPVRVQIPRSERERSGKIATRFVEEVVERAAGASEGEYWLGLQIEVLPEVAKQQLGVKHGLTVEEVLPDSPAAKAEIRKYDILIKANEELLKEPADLVKSVEGSQGKEIVITVVRSGKEQTVKVTAAKRPASEKMTEIRVPRPELSQEIKRLEEALHMLKTKAGDGSLGLWFARPAVVAPRVEVREMRSAASPKGGEPGERAKFPADLSIRITKEGEQPAKVNVKRGDKEWNVTEDKLNDLPEDIRPHVHHYLGKPMALSIRLPTAIHGLNRAIRVTPEGQVEGELRISPLPTAPVAPAAPAPPVPPATRARVAPPATGSQNARIFSYRTEKSGDSDESKLDAVLKKLDQIEDGSIAKLKEEVKQLRKELDEVRTKSPGDRK
jgi:membrane-associated protease RseP (regulator of RpoE activity)